MSFTVIVYYSGINYDNIKLISTNAVGEGIIKTIAKG